MQSDGTSRLGTVDNQGPERTKGCSRRPRLLMLTHRFPYPPNRGDRIRSYNLLRVLCRSFDVTLGCTSDEAVSAADLAHVDSQCDRVFVSPLRWLPRRINAAVSAVLGRSLTEGMFKSRSLRRRILSWQQQDSFDAVLVFCSSMFPYVDHPSFTSTRIVVDLVDVDSEKWRQMSCERGAFGKWLFGMEANRVRCLEKRVAEQVDAVALVSDAEAEVFNRAVSATHKAHGISNGVDTDYFGPAHTRHVSKAGSNSIPTTVRRAVASSAAVHDSTCLAPSESEVGGGEQQPAPIDAACESLITRLVFTGVLDYGPNVEGIIWFCQEVFPRLRNQIEVELQIVGRRPVSRVLALDRLPGVNVVGEVPDVRPYLERADIAISPLSLARGIQNKVLEAMASALPVVATAESAEGICATPGEELVIANSVDEWIDAICRLHGDSLRREQIGESARELVVREYSWQKRLAEFLALLA